MQKKSQTRKYKAYLKEIRGLDWEAIGEELADNGSAPLHVYCDREKLKDPEFRAAFQEVVEKEKRLFFLYESVRNEADAIQQSIGLAKRKTTGNARREF